MNTNEMLKEVATVYGQTKDPTASTYNSADLDRLYRAINQGKDMVIADLKLVNLITTTFTTTADTFIHTPFRDFLKVLSLRHRDSNTNLRPISAQEFYRMIPDTSDAASGDPDYYIDDLGSDAGGFNQIGLYPVPSAADTMDIVYRRLVLPMANLNYATGTIAVTNGSTTITGTGTTFTAQMVGRYFRVDNDRYWYKIASFTSTTVMVLEKAFGGTTATGAAYTIGERFAFNGQDDSYDAAVASYAKYLLLMGDKVDAALEFKAMYDDQILRFRKEIISSLDKTRMLSSENERSSFPAEAYFGYRKIGYL